MREASHSVVNELAHAFTSVKQLSAIKAGYVFIALMSLVGTVVAAVPFGV
jgi:hypothetical protein